MSNMSYCRFENTTKDIADCINELDENNWDIESMIQKASSKYEAASMKRFVRLCKQVAEDFEDENIDGEEY